jgi:hypothetical protein
MTRAAIQRRAFERRYAEQFGVTRSVAHQARMLFEKHTNRQASMKELKAHPVIAERKLRYAKAAVTRAKRKVQAAKKGVAPTMVTGETPTTLYWPDKGSPDKKKRKQ